MVLLNTNALRGQILVVNEQKKLGEHNVVHDVKYVEFSIKYRSLTLGGSLRFQPILPWGKYAKKEYMNTRVSFNF